MKNQIKVPRLASFTSSSASRLFRVVAIPTMVRAGFSAGTKTGSIVTALGTAPLASGSLDYIWGPMLKGKFKGKLMRQQLHFQQGHPELGSHSQTWGKA